MKRTPFCPLERQALAGGLYHADCAERIKALGGSIIFAHKGAAMVCRVVICKEIVDSAEVNKAGASIDEAMNGACLDDSPVIHCMAAINAIARLRGIEA